MPDKHAISVVAEFLVHSPINSLARTISSISVVFQISRNVCNMASVCQRLPSLIQINIKCNRHHNQELSCH